MNLLKMIWDETFGKLDVDWFIYICSDEGSKNVEAIEDHVMLSAERKHEVDGLAVDGGGENFR